LSPRCPFASVERCPRYYQSLSLLGDAGFTKVDPKEDETLLRRWKPSALWPRTGEQATTLSGSDNELGQFKPSMFSNFCPETSYDGFGVFASFMSRYADEIDSDSAHRRLSNMRAPAKDWRWRWAHVTPMHYTECPIYSALKHDQGGSPKMPMTDSQRSYLDRKLGSMADEAVEDSLKAVNIAQGQVTLAGQLGNSRAYLIYNDAVFEVLKAVLPRMARVAFHASSGHSDDVANVLDAAATKMIGAITESLDNRFRQAARAFGESPLVDQLRENLTRMKDQVVEDFRHGMDGDAPLAKQPPGTTVNVTQTNSPGAQLALGDNNVQTIQLQSAVLVRALDELLASGGLNNLDGDKSDVVRTLADLVRAELQKPTADVPKVRSWMERIGEVMQAAGLVVEVAKLAGALASWLSSFGGG
jgi:hypothetical protein